MVHNRVHQFFYCSHITVEQSSLSKDSVIFSASSVHILTIPLCFLFVLVDYHEEENHFSLLFSGRTEYAAETI